MAGGGPRRACSSISDAMSPTSRLVLVVAAAVIAIGATTALLLRSNESAGPERGVTLGDVTGDPGGYSDRPVTVSGEMAENDYASPADLRIAFVLGDDADRRLLVLPSATAAVPRDVGEDTVLRVRGRVSPTPAELAGQGELSPTGRLIVASGASAVLHADRVELLQPRRVVAQPRPPFPSLTVARVLERPGAYDQPISVRGSARRIGGTGFVLRGERSSVYVGAPATALRAITEGDDVTVTADVARISAFRADWLHGRAGDAPNGVGAPFLILRGLEL